MAYSVFLSHNAADSEWVSWIASHAQQIGLRVYLYEHDPQPGAPIVTDSMPALLELVQGRLEG